MTRVGAGFGECETLGQRDEVDLWRIDYVIRNDSGRSLGQFGADSWVRAEKRRCNRFTRRSGFPEFRLIGPAFFEHHEMVRNAEGLAAGQETAARSYLLAFSGDTPTFEGYEFHAEPVFPAADPQKSQTAAATGGAAAGRLPPEIQADLHLRRAEQAARAGEAAAVREAMERVASLQAAHGLVLVPGDHYRYAQAWAAAGEAERAVEAAVRYLQAGGRDAEHYTEALDLINRDGELEPGPAARHTAVVRVGWNSVSAPPPPAPEPRAGESREFDGMEFAWVPAGEFLMGSIRSSGIHENRPVTRVRISRGFWLGRHEVTLDQWQAVMGTKPSHNSACGRCPVKQVSWEDAQAFIARLNNVTGAAQYRLPTEAEWEYAARAGTAGDTYAGNVTNSWGPDPVLDRIAWYDKNSGGRTHPVGGKVPNAWGLYDMLGNVSEWVQDRPGSYPGGSVTDPTGPSSAPTPSDQQVRELIEIWGSDVGARIAKLYGSERLIRGFDVNSSSAQVRVSSRISFYASSDVSNAGFRLLRIAP